MDSKNKKEHLRSERRVAVLGQMIKRERGNTMNRSCKRYMLDGRQKKEKQ